MSSRARVLGAASALMLALAVVGCGGGSDPDLPPLPTDRPAFGFNEPILPDSPEYQLIADSGATFVRVPLNWAAVEPRQGERLWYSPDRISDDLAALGLRPLWVVTGAPCWAGDLPCAKQRPSLAPSPDHLEDFAGFVAEVAERFPEAIGIEVWNEPNIPNFWRPSPNSEVYRELLSLTADAVHATGSDVLVVMAGPSPTTPEQAAEDPQKIPFVQFITQVMSGPDAPDVDAIGIHPYSLLQKGTDPIEETIRLFEEGSDAAEAAAPGKPIWVTEVGLTTAGRYAVTPEVQADGLRTILTTIEDAGVPVISVHRFFDQVDPPLKFEEGFGVVAADRSTPKPSFCAVAEAVGAECQT